MSDVVTTNAQTNKIVIVQCKLRMFLHFLLPQPFEFLLCSPGTQSDPALISLFFWFAMPYCHKTSLLLYLSLFQNKKDRPFCQSFMLTLYHTSNGQNGQLYLFSFWDCCRYLSCCLRALSAVMPIFCATVFQE